MDCWRWPRAATQVNISWCFFSAAPSEISIGRPGSDSSRKFAESCCPIEISDGAAEKKHQDMLTCVAARGHLQQSIQVFTLESNNADRVEIAKLALAHAQRGGGDFNWIVGRPLAAAKRFQNPPGFFTAAASHFGAQYR